jgi:hypothetical protein
MSESDDDVPMLLCEGSFITNVSPPLSLANSVSIAASSVNLESNVVNLEISPEISAFRQSPEISPPKQSPIPLCILTGWLGAGKTTLLTRIVHELGARGMKVAIVQNEVSALGVEDALRLTDENGVFGNTTSFARSSILYIYKNFFTFTGEILELANGCVCCSVKAVPLYTHIQ